jgi:hypothetical protein
VEWVSDWGCVATTNGTLMDWSNDTIWHNYGKPSTSLDW